MGCQPEKNLCSHGVPRDLYVTIPIQLRIDGGSFDRGLRRIDTQGHLELSGGFRDAAVQVWTTNVALLLRVGYRRSRRRAS